MSLVLEIEYLSGISFAAISPASPTPDWPPQPDRVFSALVATWSARGQKSQEAQALQWLESQSPPRVIASPAVQRTTVTVFVPPNDPRSDKQKNARGVLPFLRSRQPRQFPAARPYDPIARLEWDDASPAPETLEALQRLAHDTAYVGHSTSLARCRFFVADPVSSDAAKAMQRRIYPGRFFELCRDFEAGRRPLPGPASTLDHEHATHVGSQFDTRWLLLEHVGGDMPDLRACAIVAKTIRDAVLSGYQRMGMENDIPEIVSGHDAIGKPSRGPHLAIVPMPFVGFPYSDGHVMGYALVPPRGSELLENAAFLRALSMVMPLEHDRRILTVKPKEGIAGNAGFSIRLSATREAPAVKRSLDSRRYIRPACTFATVTPIVLDRHLKNEGKEREAEIRDQIAAACRNIGLPEPEEVFADKHSAFEGAPSAYPSARSPVWMRWRLPASLASRFLTHAVIRFAAPVEGPVILGAGRFVGMGLCRPLFAQREVA
ncbi:MAG TPA: type I-U CRISPR-associated protein Csb2 [Gammaproteobacteria bacterium]